MPKFGTQNAWFEYLWAGIWKQHCHIWNQHPWIYVIAKFDGKKMPKFVTKNALHGYFWPKIPYLGIFDQKCLIWVFSGNNFKNTIVIFEISTLKFVFLQNLTEKQKCLNLGPKMPDLGILGMKFWKTIVIFEISTLKFV